MGRLVSASGIVGVAGRSEGRRVASHSLGRAGVPRLPAAWIASALGLGAGAFAIAAAMQLAEALRSPVIVGFPPIP